MKIMRYIGLAVLAIQAVAQPEIVVDGVWCSNGEDNFIQWECELEATALEKDQFCIMLKATKTGRGVIVGKGVSRYKKSSYTPHRAASLLKHDVFYDATVFSFASHQGGYRLMMVDVTDKSMFDLRLGPENTFEGFVVESGGMIKTATRNAFSGYVRFVRTEPLPKNFDDIWEKTNQNTYG